LVLIELLFCYSHLTNITVIQHPKTPFTIHTASSVAAAGGRSLLQFGKGKGIGMQATSVSVAQPMNLAPMPVAPLMYGGYGMPMAAPMAAGPTYVPSPVWIWGGECFFVGCFFVLCALVAVRSVVFALSRKRC
jgi:hypothetical protein